MTDECEENAARKGAGTAAVARYAGGPGRTPGASVPLLRSEWEAETGWHVHHHLHLGLRKGTGAGWLTARTVVQLVLDFGKS